MAMRFNRGWNFKQLDRATSYDEVVKLIEAATATPPPGLAEEAAARAAADAAHVAAADPHSQYLKETTAEAIYATLEGVGPQLIYQGAWNASTNSPALADGTGTAGSFYKVNVAGTRNLGSGAIAFAIGDFVYYDGSVWSRIDNSAASLPSTVPTTVEENIEFVRGVIDTTGSGSILSGDGFTIVRNNVGDVTVTFDTPFSDIPSVTFGATGGGSSLGPIASHKSGAARTGASFRVEVVSIGSGFADGVFDFTACGTR